MGRIRKVENKNGAIFDKSFVKEFEERYAEELELANKSFSREEYIRHYLWGKGFEFALELVSREFLEKH